MALKLGAIRWDAVWAVGAAAHTAMENVLSPAEWHFRAPFWADETAAHSISLAPTQADMDAEIAFAAANGVDYWAFLQYNPAYFGAVNAGSESYAAYQASADKDDVKWAMIRQCNHLGSTGNYSAMVAEMVAYCQTSNYQKVLTNRPLVFIFNASESLASFWGGSYVNLKAAIDAFRAAAQSAGLGNPYIVAMSTYSSTQVVADKTGIGADACTMYADGSVLAPRQPFSTLRTHQESAVWPELLAAGGMVPLITCGWDRRPRTERPVYWEASHQRPYFGADLYTVAPTPLEFQAHVEAAIDYIGAHPTQCPAETALVYSWSEFDESGGICPTLGDPTGALLAAVAAARA